MKRIINRLIPASLRSSINSYRIQKQKVSELKDLFNSTFRCLLKDEEDADSIMKRILLRYHVIEKGLTMPERRNGFGRDVLLGLISDILTYIDRYGKQNEQISVATGVVADYLAVHEKQGFALDEKVLSSIHKLLDKYPCPAVHQKEENKEHYFSTCDKPFDEFSKSRHSLRHFDGPAKIEKLKDALQLAQNAPSACNRQATRVRVVSDKDVISKIFSIHRGNRGFGHLADKLLVLSTDMRYWEIKTCFGGYVDGGIYAMNLLYALHYNKIGACPLNACFTPKEEVKVRKMINLPDNENLVLFIAIGGVPDNFRLANSHRYNSDNVVTFL